MDDERCAKREMEGRRARGIERNRWMNDITRELEEFVVTDCKEKMENKKE